LILIPHPSGILLKEGSKAAFHGAGRSVFALAGLGLRLIGYDPTSRRDTPVFALAGYAGAGPTRTLLRSGELHRGKHTLTIINKIDPQIINSSKLIADSSFWSNG
jgi:hypothetical protein